jgi:hypothetical protein
VELWTIYDSPEDGRCVVRKVLVEEDGLLPDDAQPFESLIEARSALARRGLIRVPRAEQDEPALLETWL